MVDLDLGGTWRASATDAAAEPTATGDTYDDSHWTALDVPGHWGETAAFADHEGPVMYRRRFTATPPTPSTRTWLRVEGIFSQADVWMDDAYLGDTDGYFAPHSFEVGDLIRDGVDHVLAVEVSCRRSEDSTRQTNLLGIYDHPPSMPRAPNPGGIWRPVRLVETGPVAIRHFRVVCDWATEQQATVRIRAVLDAAGEQRVELRRRVAGVEETETVSLAPGENHVERTVTVTDPELWWPAALGDPTLVSVGLDVIAPDGRPSDRRVVETGLRSITLTGWVLAVNGRRLFLKGANQRPLDHWPNRTDPARYDAVVRDARAAGLDLLRVQGHVAPPGFYEAADRHGLLVWADLPLHGGLSGGIRRDAARQARDAVDLLAHHPSLVIWGAHNGAGTPRRRGGDPSRPGRVHRLADAATAQQLPSWGTTVVERAVARALRRADRSRPVVTHSGRVPSLPLLDGTDTQMGVGWYVGGLRSLERWAAAFPRLVRFVSDFGAQALDGAAERTAAATWPEVDWAALARAHGIEAAQLNDRVPPEGHGTAAEWADATRRYQALVLRHHVETLRRLKYRPAGGFCLTSFRAPPSGDPWAVTDHDGTPRPALDAVLAACAPVIVVADRLPATMACRQGVAVDIHVVNDRRDAVEDAVVTATIVSSEGETRRRWTGSFDADSVTLVSTLQMVTPDTPGPLRIELELAAGGSTLATNCYTTDVEVRP